MVKKYKYITDDEQEDVELEILKWCEVDMDSDGVTELLIKLSTSNILLFHSENNIVYGYAFPYRGMKNTKTDGTFEGSGSAADTYIGKVRFEDNNCFYDEIGAPELLDNQKSIYRLDKNNSTKSKFLLFLEEQDKKEDVLWNDLQ